MTAPVPATGLDALLAEDETAGSALRGRRIGLLANAASVTSGFVPAPRALLDAGYDVRVLFGPEHGFRSAAQDMEAVAPGEPSRLPVVSLYGSTFEELSPCPEDLEGLDVVVSDLPDVGSRYYTFVWTTALMMKACAARGIPVVVLDRPNPLGGEIVEGNLPEKKLLSFVGLYPVPVRHGMTPGELARLVNVEHGLGCDLTVVPMKSGASLASRAELAGGGAWVLPSPNMPSPETARVYPGACLAEGTNLSEGRGTTRPFELLGAPWLDADEAADAANALGLKGVVFRSHVFRPTFQKHAGVSCGGVQAHVTDHGTFRPFEAYLRLLKVFYDLDPDRFRWRTEPYEYRADVPAIDLLAGTATYRRLVGEGASLDSWIETFRADIARFAPSRERSLLYPSKKSPVVLLVVGAHESGKTTVAVKLIEALVKEGLRVGSLKHTDHEYETDVEGKDSQRHKAAGAEPAVLVAGRRSAVHRGPREISASDPLTPARHAHDRPALSVFLKGEYGLGSCDLVVVEGFRSESYPKIEVCRAATGRAPLCEDDPNVIAVVTDHATKHASMIPRFTFEEVPVPFFPSRKSSILFSKKSPVFVSFEDNPCRMKAILVPKPGGPEALVWGEAPDPLPGPGEVVVRVRATAVNRADLLQSQGKYPPPEGASEILGMEAAGEVEGTGERVFFLLAGGGYAEKVAVARSMLMPIPRALSFADAAAIPEAWFTAYLNLFQEGGLKAGERVLVHAGGSGVGTAAIQLARRAGASVVATARSAKKCVALAALGADLAVDTSREEFLSRIEQTFGKESVDLVLDPVGGPLFGPNLKALRRGGRIVLIASMAGPSAEIDLRIVLVKRLRIIGSTLRSRPLAEKIALTRRVRTRRPARFRRRVARPGGGPDLPALRGRRSSPPHGRERERGQDRARHGLKRGAASVPSARGHLRPRRHARRCLRGDPRVDRRRPRGVRPSAHHARGDATDGRARPRGAGREGGGSGERGRRRAALPRALRKSRTRVLEASAGRRPRHAEALRGGRPPRDRLEQTGALHAAPSRVVRARGPLRLRRGTRRRFSAEARAAHGLDGPGHSFHPGARRGVRGRHADRRRDGARGRTFHYHTSQRQRDAKRARSVLSGRHRRKSRRASAPPPGLVESAA